MNRHFNLTIFCSIVVFLTATVVIRAQTNTSAADTVSVRSSTGSVSLVTGAGNRILQYPSQSGTLALVGDSGSTSDCCCGDRTTSGAFIAATGGNEKRYTDIIDTKGMKNGLVFYLTGPAPGNFVWCYFGYETAADSTGPWYTMVDLMVGRIGAQDWNPPVFLEVRSNGIWGNQNRDVGSFIHSGTSAQVRIGGGVTIFRYVRGFVRNLGVDFQYVLRVS